MNRRIFTLYFTVLLALITSFKGVAQVHSDEEKTPLYIAIESGNIEKAKELISAGADVNEEYKWLHTPMHAAINTDRIDMVELLLENGAITKSGMNQAAENNNVQLVKLLIEHHFDHGYALVYAAENDNLPMVKLLVDDGASVNISQKRKRGLFRKYYVSPIQFAAKNGNQEMVLYLIDKGVALTTAIDECFEQKQNDILKTLIEKSPNKNKVLETAFVHSNNEIINYLLAHGASSNHQDDLGNNLLHMATAHANLELAKRCVTEFRLSPNATNDLGETPLMFAVSEDALDIVSFLVTNGADVNQQDKAGKTALFYVNSKTFEMFNYLLANGANIDHKTKNNTSLLIGMAQNKQYECVQYLVEQGASVTDVNDEGFTAFQYIISRMHHDTELDDLFLSKGADINAKSAKGGRTLLFNAIEQGNLERVKQLHKLGADMNPRDDKGRRPRTDNREMIKYLVENGADINAIDSRHDSYLCVAVKKNDLELAHFLISNGIDVNQNCYFEEPPLIKAIEDDNSTLVRFLVDNEADLSAIGYFERNVMEYAERKGNQEIIEFLKSRGAMSKTDRNDLYRKSMKLESDIKSALAQKNEQALVSHLKKVDGLIIQDRLIKRVVRFAGEVGNPVIIEQVVSALEFDLNTVVNEDEQSVIFIAVKNDRTTLVSYLIHKEISIDLLDKYDKTAADYARSTSMKRIFKEIGQ